MPPGQVMKQGATPGTQPRLRWRVVIHAGEKIDASRGQQPLAWHLAECANPASPEAHCDIGRRLIATDGNPDGHCLIGGTCPRCEQAPVEEAAPPAPEPQAEPAPEPPLAETPTEASPGGASATK
jgi:hypothetical protein